MMAVRLTQHAATRSGGPRFKRSRLPSGKIRPRSEREEPFFLLTTRHPTY